jgi:glycerol uptake facilitator-like aquaporin
LDGFQRGFNFAAWRSKPAIAINHVPGFIVAQLIGAALGALAASALFRSAAMPERQRPRRRPGSAEDMLVTCGRLSCADYGDGAFNSGPTWREQLSVLDCTP